MTTADLDRVTAATLRVLACLVQLRSLEDAPSHSDGMWALALAREARVHVGSIYAILARLEKLSWVRSKWESQHPIEGRPRRRFYRLTDDGLAHANRLLQERGTISATPSGMDRERITSIAIGGGLVLHEGGLEVNEHQ
jgi:PadR family transcriptional regulator, regulatory protein PadR